jgi:hypothetical protein
MKVTEKLVCINTDEFYLNLLTYGKIYNATWTPQAVYSSDGVYWEITNDLGQTKEYHESKFITLKQWREKQIKSLFGS